ncbi:MAG: acetylglutamate kinase [Elusimicrobiota bacterium]
MKDLVVIKYGGSVLKDVKLKHAFFGYTKKLIRTHAVVIIHGGGKEITQLLDRLGIKTKFVNGLRFTDEETLSAAEMVLSGKVNKQLVAEFNTCGITAVGLSGRDAGMVYAKPIKKLGFVGKTVKINPGVIHVLIKQNIVPVISPIATNKKTCSALNLNADTFAAEVAVALHARRLVFLTDVPGVLDAQGNVVPIVRTGNVNKMISTGIITGGMIPKIRSCVETIKKGVGEVVITNNCWGNNVKNTRVIR